RLGSSPPFRLLDVVRGFLGAVGKVEAGNLLLVDYGQELLLPLGPYHGAGRSPCWWLIRARSCPSRSAPTRGRRWVRSGSSRARLGWSIGPRRPGSFGSSWAGGGVCRGLWWGDGLGGWWGG